LAAAKRGRTISVVLPALNEAATVGAVIDVGTCAAVSCGATLPAVPIDVYVVADPDASADECLEQNNVSILHDVQCEIIG
jgi:hypothetical protein